MCSIAAIDSTAGTTRTQPAPAQGKCDSSKSPDGKSGWEETHIAFTLSSAAAGTPSPSPAPGEKDAKLAQKLGQLASFGAP